YYELCGKIIQFYGQNGFTNRRIQKLVQFQINSNSNLKSEFQRFITEIQKIQRDYQYEIAAFPNYHIEDLTISQVIHIWLKSRLPKDCWKKLTLLTSTNQIQTLPQLSSWIDEYIQQQQNLFINKPHNNFIPNKFVKKTYKKFTK